MHFYHLHPFGKQENEYYKKKHIRHDILDDKKKSLNNVKIFII